MINFTKSEWTNGGVTYQRYTADRKRGGGSWVFYNGVPHDTTYSPTWPHAIEQNATFEGVIFRCYMDPTNIYVDFLKDLSASEEDDLDALYTAHVAPVPV